MIEIPRSEPPRMFLCFESVSWRCRECQGRMIELGNRNQSCRVGRPDPGDIRGLVPVTTNPEINDTHRCLTVVGTLMLTRFEGFDLTVPSPRPGVGSMINSRRTKPTSPGRCDTSELEKTEADAYQGRLRSPTPARPPPREQLRRSDLLHPGTRALVGVGCFDE